MNREILFRGKRIDNEEWAEGFYMESILKEKKYFIVADLLSREMVVVDPETVGQFTGLTDRGGRKIFEGDVVNVHVFTQELGESLGVVEGEQEFKGEVSLDHLGLRVGNEYVLYLYGLHEESFEVIGNSFDHPHLLNN